MFLICSGKATKVNLQLGSYQAVVEMEANSIATVELPPNLTL